MLIHPSLPPLSFPREHRQDAGIHLPRIKLFCAHFWNTPFPLLRPWGGCWVGPLFTSGSTTLQREMSHHSLSSSWRDTISRASVFLCHPLLPPPLIGW
ncbi:hypothetical protein CEXT_227251 [Caerostris extrusa]|uniref:Uncharacterized protein n=1 Tax=Caerostris extrusa TaxID=172846 RepID=A0AAV4ND07_CAEEX|nr:hypothetical protein CEXT_227251 [Caerostris extrusa]